MTKDKVRIYPEGVDKSAKVGTMSSSPVPYKGQKYSKLKSNLLKSGELFVDPEFPANNKSLFYSRVDMEIVWKRPNEIVEDENIKTGKASELCKVPRLVVDGVSCDDLNEGELGNTWFVSACSSLAQEPKLFAKVLPNPKEQEWKEAVDDKPTYAGIFHFQFWRYGQWLDIVVDDLLPTKNGKLVFCHSKSRNEFWSALLEKAFAKLYGDYETLSNGVTADALVDFTGGVAEKIIIKEAGLEFEPTRKKMFTDLKNAVENKALATCCIACSKGEAGQEAGHGLIKGHGYGITSVKQIPVDKSLRAAFGGVEVLELLRLRNPWGTKEWTGPWSDDSKEWTSLSMKDRDKMGIKFQQEGEFWMAFVDFIQHFTNLDICHFVNTSIFSLKKTWHESLAHGEWMTGARGTAKDRAGGNSKNDTFLFNPQYVFDIGGLDGDNIMVSMEQDDSLSLGKEVGSGHNEIGFHIMKVEDNRTFRAHQNGIKVVESEFKNSRSVFVSCTLPKGRFVLIPSTSQPGKTGKFMVRMYTSSNPKAGALTKECPKASMCSKPYVLVTRIKVIKAEGLPPDPKGNSMDPFVEIKCEGETVKSVYKKGTNNPEWNIEAIFYRKKSGTVPITVEVYNHNLMVDDFMGMATIEEQGSEDPETKELELFGKKTKEKEIKRDGKLHVEITSSDDLTVL